MENDPKYTVMIVDDIEENIDVLVETLADDYDIMAATDGETAIHDIRENLPDLVLLDIMMPGMDGYEVCERLKLDSKTKDIPVIFVTAKGGIDDETRGFDIGAVDYITKPISPPIVQARVKNHLILKEARERLKKQNDILTENARLREDVERMSRHDLKTPLASIISQTRLLAEEINSPEQQKAVRIIEKSGYQALNMVNLSLDLFKMEKGSYAFTPTPVDLAEIIRKIFLDVEDMASIKKTGLKIEIKNRLPEKVDSFSVYGEEILCYSMFANLIKNAVEASPDKKDVTVILKAGNTPTIHIHNSGTVPEEIIDHFFEKYTSRGRSSGTGLGTYSAKVMAETQNGSISMLTSGEEGTTVSVSLPEVPENEIMAVPVDKKDPAGNLEILEKELNSLSPMRVLIVDDDAYNREALLRFLNKPNIELEFAENGVKAIEKVKDNLYTIIFMDMEMPIMNGMESMTQIRAIEKGSNLPVKSMIIALSGHDDRQTIDKCLAAEFDDYLVKPVEKTTLYRKIIQWLGTDKSIGEDLPSDRKPEKIDLAIDDFIVEIDEDLVDLIPAFIENKRKDITVLEQAINGRDTASVKKISHKLKGSLNIYGFKTASKICHQIETCVAPNEQEGILKNIDLLKKHLTRVAHEENEKK